MVVVVKGNHMVQSSLKLNNYCGYKTAYMCVFVASTTWVSWSSLATLYVVSSAKQHSAPHSS